MIEYGAGLISIAASIALEKLIDYSGFGDYIKNRIKSGFDTKPFMVFKPWYQNRKEKPISGSKLFWDNVFSQKLSPGTNVHLDGFILGDWFPRKPGLFWTSEGIQARQFAEDFIVERNGDSVTYSMYGKRLMADLGGVGTIKYTQNKEYVPLTASSDGVVHSGIPIVVSEEVMSKINSARDSHRWLSISLKGVFNHIPDTFHSTFHRHTNIPRVVVQVNARKDVELSSTDIPEIVTPWTLFRRHEKAPGDPFGFSYVTCDLGSDDQSAKIEWMKENIRLNGGEKILTDFDQDSNPLNAVFPLNDSISIHAFDAKLFEYMQNMTHKFPELNSVTISARS